jgi:integrase
MLRQGYSHSYVNHIIFAFQHWFAWQGAPIKIKALPRNKTIPKYLTKEEASKLLASCIDPRDRAIVALLLYGGLRANEVCKLTLEDVDLDRRLIRIRDPKNDVEDYVVISERCTEILRAYMSSRNGIRDNRLFHGKNGCALTYNCIRQMLRRRSKEGGIKRVTAHMLRHTLGTQLVANGCDVSFVQKQLRHRNISTTMIYVHINKEMLKKAYDKYVPEF